jgi:uncharacterized protein YciI
MSHKLDYKEVFVILAETLDGWKSPSSEEGKSVLQLHYQWATTLLQNGQILMAGPLDRELFIKPDIDILGHITGLIIIKAASREEAEAIACKDPFHIHGYRKNKVCSFAIGFCNPEISNVLSKML